MGHYTIGIDYGTLSARVVVVDVETGDEVGQSVSVYSQGIIQEKLPGCNRRLSRDWALQDPSDYLRVLRESVPAAVKQAQVSVEDIIGIAVDCTTSTMLPVDRNGEALCMQERWRNEPHAWIKLWKHHAASEQARRMTELAREQEQSWLPYYGNTISSEWSFPKIWQLLLEAPELYEAAYTFMEASDWIIMQMTGEWVKSSCALGYKALWNAEQGFPEASYFKTLDWRLETIVSEKLIKDDIRILPIGTKAGELTPKAAASMGLRPGIPVAVALIDAHVTMPALKITEPGKLLMIMGTSTCDILLSEEKKAVPGICGVVRDGAIPGYYAYEAGQSGVGDIFGWFVEQCVPGSYYAEAFERQISVHQLLEEKAAGQRIGEHGLLALDWMNGNRSILVDSDLSGMVLGLSLHTRPEDLYRALIEATAYGQRMIVDNFMEHGIPIQSLYAAGGLPEKNQMLMQIYADVLNRDIHLSGSAQAPALGSAIFAAAAAGRDRGGYDSVQEAAEAMGTLKEQAYHPIPEHVEQYNRIYQEYKKLYDYFGRGENPVMKTLRRLQYE